MCVCTHARAMCTCVCAHETLQGRKTGYLVTASWNSFGINGLREKPARFRGGFGARRRLRQAGRSSCRPGARPYRRAEGRGAAMGAARPKNRARRAARGRRWRFPAAGYGASRPYSHLVTAQATTSTRPAARRTAAALTPAPRAARPASAGSAPASPASSPRRRCSAAASGYATPKKRQPSHNYRLVAL